MDRLLIALAIVAAVGVVALVSRRRRMPDAPTQRRYRTPDQLDRTDFGDVGDGAAPWLVAVFTSATCTACQSVLEKASVLASPQVAVVEVEFAAQRALHEKYDIDAVPATLIADADGVVVGSFLGPMSATDLWAAVAEAREPGSTPSHHGHDGDDGRPGTG